MYQEFIQYIKQRNPNLGEIDDEPSPPSLDPDTVIKEALEFFGKAEEYDALAKSVELRKSLKKAIHGKLVQEVTGLQGSVVGKIIAQVKEMAPPEELITKSEDEVRRMIEEARRVVEASRNGTPA
jgi:sugar-specific transcriptional regulator TrmB